MGLEELAKKGTGKIRSIYNDAKKRLTDYSVRASSALHAPGHFIPIAPFTSLAGAYYALANAPEQCFSAVQACSEPEPLAIYKAVAGAVVAGFSLADIIMREPCMIRGGMLGVSVQKHAATPDELTRVKSRYSGFVDQLLAHGIPEELIEQRRDFWETMRQVERNGVISNNPTFKVRDKAGKSWLLKLHTDKTRAEMEAAANYYLGDHFAFIAPGGAPKPLEANGVYLTMQQDVARGWLVRNRPPEYWMTALALFHRDARQILQENSITLPNVPTRDSYSLHNLVDQGKHVHGLHVDWRRMDEAIAYLQQSPYKTAIHGDLKRENRLGSYLVDLESMGIGHPARDLVLVLMQIGVKRENWEQYLHLYLQMKGTVASHDAEFAELKEGVEHAAVYAAVKEIAGSSLREVRPSTRQDNAQLAGALAAYA